MKPHKLSFRKFSRVYSLVPRLTVDLVIKNKNGVLLSKRSIPPKLGWWHFPGGTILMNESIEETLNRVAKEELNTKVKIIKLLGVIEYSKKNAFGFTKALVYLVKPLSQKLSGGPQAKEINFFITPPKKTLYEVKKFIEENI